MRDIGQLTDLWTGRLRLPGGAFNATVKGIVKNCGYRPQRFALPVQSQQIVVQPPRVAVSLTFDDGLQSQYDLAFRRAL